MDRRYDKHVCFAKQVVDMHYRCRMNCDFVTFHVQQKRHSHIKMLIAVLQNNFMRFVTYERENTYPIAYLDGPSKLSTSSYVD